MREVFNQNKDFNTLLTSPKLSKEKKRQYLKMFFQMLIHLLQNTLKLLLIVSERRTYRPNGRSFIEFANAEKGIAEAKVTSVRPLTEEET